MRTAKDFKPANTSPVDDFIENHIYPQLDEENGTAAVYVNLIQMEEVDLKQLKDRLKSLGFKTSMSKLGLDDVLNVNV